jgi:hypothetical protein
MVRKPLHTVEEMAGDEAEAGLLCSLLGGCHWIPHLRGSGDSEDSKRNWPPQHPTQPCSGKTIWLPWFLSVKMRQMEPVFSRLPPELRAQV